MRSPLRYNRSRDLTKTMKRVGDGCTIRRRFSCVGTIVALPTIVIVLLVVKSFGCAFDVGDDADRDVPTPGDGGSLVDSGETGEFAPVGNDEETDGFEPAQVGGGVGGNEGGPLCPSLDHI